MQFYILSFIFCVLYLLLENMIKLIKARVYQSGGNACTAFERSQEEDEAARLGGQ